MDKSAFNKPVDEIIADLPKSEQAIMKRLRALIRECLPKAEEKNSYGVPFYRRHRMICFIWPPSIRWGPKKKNDEKDKLIVLGFCQGYLMANEDNVLLAEGRKQVYCMYFRTLAQIDDTQIRALLFEAGMIDDEFGSKKLQKKFIRGRSPARRKSK